MFGGGGGGLQDSFPEEKNKIDITVQVTISGLITFHVGFLQWGIVTFT